MKEHTYKDGRTMRQAIEAEDSYQLIWRDERGHYAGEYWPIGCAGIETTLKYARERFPKEIGQTVEVGRVLRQSQIGAMFIEPCGTRTL